MAKTITYEAPPTMAALIRGRATIRTTMGPIGSGKTTGSLMALFHNALNQEPLDGVRSTRFGLVRNTQEQLRTTTLRTALEWFPDAEVCTWEISNKALVFDIPHPSGDGTRVQSEWYLISLDEEKDIRRLLSLELTGLFFNELREFQEELFINAMSRIGRYPKKDFKRGFGGATYPCGIGDTNPPPEGHWLQKAMLNPPPGWDAYFQPPAVIRDSSSPTGWRVNPEAENLDNLHDDYYKGNLERNAGNDEWIRVYLGNEFGRTMGGEPVFGHMFRIGFHVSDKPLRFDPFYPVLIGIDFGLFPAALIGQPVKGGQLQIHREIIGSNVQLPSFIQQQLVPSLLEDYRGARFYMVGDPSGLMRSALAGNNNSFDVLKKLGFTAVPAPTNLIEPRLQAVEKFLMGQVDGRGRLLVDARCTTLIDAMIIGYRFRAKKSGDLADKPEKSHPESDVADVLQYLCLVADTPTIALNVVSHEVKIGGMDLTGWV